MSTTSTGSIIGLTGGIATGKSTVADMFRDLDVVVIDADELSRRIVEPGKPAYDDIVDAFGADILDADERIDRQALADVVFEDDEARNRLESITHPRIAEAMFDRAQAAFDEGQPWVLYEAALLVESGSHRLLDALIVVDCPSNRQLQRLKRRDGVDESQARRRIDAQMPLQQKRDAADFVIDNSADLDKTRRQVEHLRQLIDKRIEQHGTATP